MDPQLNTKDIKKNLGGEDTEQSNTVSDEITTSEAVKVDKPKIENDSNNINYVLCFKSIHSFVMAMYEEFGSKSKALRLYHKLIEKTTFSHEFAIKKHVRCFMDWCITNRESIYSKNFQTLQGKISYSEKVHLNMKDLFRLADNDQKKVMWQHILTISALVDSTGRAKQILKQSLDSSNETNFLTNIIEKVEKNIDVNNENPMEAIGSIMSSGVFTDLISSMNNQVSSGELDVSKMLSVVQNMVGTITKDQPEMGGLLNGLMGSINSQMDEKSLQ